MSLASPCFDLVEESEISLDKLLNLTLDDKVTYSKMLIQKFYIKQRGKVYVSYSGGKDSTVLLDLVRSLYPEVPAVFFDTGLEFPEIRDMARATDNVEFRKPKMSFKKVIETTGYPVVGKECAHAIEQARKGNKWGLERMSDDGRYGYEKYAYLIDAPFKISEKCCQIMKKDVSKEYFRETGRAPYIGTKALDSQRRMSAFVRDGATRERTSSYPASNPLSIWSDDDVWAYIQTHSLKYCPVYDMGYKGTGCIFCMFGIMSDRDRFLKLKVTHPKQWVYCMKPLDEGGLGMREVLEFMNIPTGCEQANLLDFIEKENEKNE